MYSSHAIASVGVDGKGVNGYGGQAFALGVGGGRSLERSALTEQVGGMRVSIDSLTARRLSGV